MIIMIMVFSYSSQKTKKSLMMRLYIILMPRSLCVCVRLSVTFTFIFIINYYYLLFSRAKLIIKILLPTKLSYSNSIERSNSLLGGCISFRLHLRGGWDC
jgi:hypothetical protein